MVAKKDKVGNVPNLRFPGFTEAWERKKLGDIAEFKAGYAFKSIDMLSEKSTYQLLKMSNVYQSELRLDRNPSYWGNINHKQREFLLRKGDSILTLTGTFGKRDFGYSIMINDDDKYLLNQRLVSLRERKGISANGFINQILSSERFLFQFFAEAKGGTGNQTNVGTDDVKNIVLNFPSYLEQVTIASFLSLIEERIQTQSKIIKELKLLKSTVSKRIFTQKLTFNASNNQSTWVVKKLEDICVIIGGGTPETGKNEYWNGNIQWFTPTEIKQNFVSKSERKITQLGLKSSSAKILPIGTILVTTRATIGETAITLEECTTNQGFQSLVVKEGFDNYFLFNWIKQNKFELTKRANGSTFPEISKTEIEKIQITIPEHSEQAKIGDFLSKIDMRIDVEEKLLKQFDRQKKYLLSNLFI